MILITVSRLGSSQEAHSSPSPPYPGRRCRQARQLQLAGSAGGGRRAVPGRLAGGGWCRGVPRPPIQQLPAVLDWPVTPCSRDDSTLIAKPQIGRLSAGFCASPGRSEAVLVGWDGLPKRAVATAGIPVRGDSLDLRTGVSGMGPRISLVRWIESLLTTALRKGFNAFRSSQNWF